MILIRDLLGNTVKFLTFAASMTIIAAHAQMTLDGGFSVTPSGAAAYAIPILTPPGIAGVEPKLALNFGSQSGNGLMGVAWNISGLSSITRCPQTTPQDGAKTGITYTASDRFCLDGQRLMLVAGTYGAAGSEYRTEIESFSKVTAYGAATGGGPAYFIVKTKSGLTMEYGNSTDSVAFVAGSGASLVYRIWGLNKTYDTKGNAMKVSYTQGAYPGPDSGNIYASRIDYTSNANTGLAAANSVIFNYEVRPDLVVGFQGGVSIGNQQRLKNITTQSSGANVFVYTPTYEISPATKRSRITSVSLCSASGACLPATTMTLSSMAPVGSFNWQGPIQSSTLDSCLSTCGSWQTIDLNNDGKMDLLHFKDNSGNVSAWLSNGDGTFAIQNYQVSDTALLAGTWQLLDVNGDGRADLVHLKDDAGHVSVWLSNGDGTFAISNVTFTTDTTLSNGVWLVLDVNGDGLGDLVHLTTNLGDMRLWKSNGNGTFTMSAMTRASDSTSVDTNFIDGGSWQVMDIDGDGLTDLVHLTNNDGDVRVWKSKGDGTFKISQFTTSADTVYANGFWQVLDMNDDGLPDLLHFTTNSGDMRVWISRGNGTFQISAVTNSVDTALTAGSWQTVDFNGDGRQDLLHFPGSGTTAYLWTFDSKGALNGPPVPLSGAIEGCLICGKWVAGDFNGEGFVDLVHLLDDSSNYVIWHMPRIVSDLPSAISSGVGTKISWTTDALPRVLGSRYTMSLASSAGTTLTVIPAISVVTNVYADTGIGGTRQTSYGYDSMRMELNGRGYLGFNWMQATDLSTGADLSVRHAATGLVTRTYYAQSFPFTGMVTQSSRGTSATAWSNLSLTTNIYGCNDPAATSITGCTYANGRRYFVYPAYSSTTSHDLDGTALPQTVVTSSNIDAYGNVGAVTTVTRNPDGSATDYSSTVTNTYAAPDLTNWYIGRLLKSTVVSTGPAIPTVVTPGSGGLPNAPAPNLPPQLMSIILNLLLDD